MRFSYDEIITRFQDTLETPKMLIEETFNKPDATDIVVNRYISIKNFGDFHMLIIFEMDGLIVRFLRAYRIHPKLLDGFNINKMKPIDVLTEFMNKYGIAKEIPQFGEHKILIERKMKIFFLGVLDIEKYLADLKNI
jgi:hypothetical protein